MSHKVYELEILHGKCQKALRKYKETAGEPKKLWMDEYVFLAMQIQTIHLRKMLEPSQSELVHG